MKNISMILENIFRSKKQQQELLKRQGFLDENIVKATDVQKTTMEIAWKNQLLGEELNKRLLENDSIKNALLVKENQLNKMSNELEERIQQSRKTDIYIEAKKSELRVKEQVLNQKLIDIATEREVIKVREFDSDKQKQESIAEVEKYHKMELELAVEMDRVKIIEEELIAKKRDSDEKNAIANAIFEKAAKIDEEIKLKETKIEEERLKVETVLREKIEEYDRRLEEMNSVKGLVDDIKYDSSKEGIEAKIVVKEAIRIAKNVLADAKVSFDRLDEQYVSGTFMGFSTPIVEIDKCYTELKEQYLQVKEHIISTDSLPKSVLKWLASIEENLIKADTCIKSWEYSEAFRNIIYGLAACKNYELLLNILNEWEMGPEESEETTNDVNKDWYEILEISPNATKEEIKRQWRKLVNKYHPDRADELNKEEYTLKTMEINEAYNILYDELKRKEFDEKRNNNR
jgi:hypothetical protein